MRKTFFISAMKYLARKIMAMQKSFFEWLYLVTGVKISISGNRIGCYTELRKGLRLFQQQAAESSVKFPVTKLSPCYEDQHDGAGSLMFHYFFQDLIVAQSIFRHQPERHIDIGSRIDGFVAHIASYRTVEVLDIRPMQVPITNVRFLQADLMNLQSDYIECADSISCLHALEHFGLGRYGDNIVFDGYILGFNNIAKMLKRGGRFYLSVPMGKQCVEFHAHRIFSLKYLLELITPVYQIDKFSFIDDSNHLHENITISDGMISNNCGCCCGCAIFELVKL